MKAVLLCAGFGTRLYPLTRDVAKPLLPVAGKPIVEHLLDHLATTGHVDEIVLVSNDRFAGQFAAWRDGLPSGSPPIRILNDGATDNHGRLGSVRDLALAVTCARLTGERVLVAAGDNLFRGSLKPFFDDHHAHPRNLVLRHREDDPDRLRRTGVVEIDQDGRIVRFVEKPERPPSHWAVPALYVLEPSALAWLGLLVGEVPNTDAIGGLIAWLSTREPVFTHELRGRRLDVGDLESYRTAERWLKEADDDLDGLPST